MAETIARCVVCQRHEGEQQLNRFREPDRISPGVPLGPVTACPKCGRLSCPDCQHDQVCCAPDHFDPSRWAGPAGMEVARG